LARIVKSEILYLRATESDWAALLHKAAENAFDVILEFVQANSGQFPYQLPSNREEFLAESKGEAFLATLADPCLDEEHLLDLNVLKNIFGAWWAAKIAPISAHFGLSMPEVEEAGSSIGCSCTPGARWDSKGALAHMVACAIMQTGKGRKNKGLTMLPEVLDFLIFIRVLTHQYF
jgi:hypothetical protein